MECIEEWFVHILLASRGELGIMVNLVSSDDPDTAVTAAIAAANDDSDRSDSMLTLDVPPKKIEYIHLVLRVYC